MDNRVFNVNGRGKDMLIETIRLALWQEHGCYGDSHMPTDLAAKGYMISDVHGLILLWHVSQNDSAQVQFLVPHTPEMLGELAYEWLHGAQAKNCLPHLTGWDADCDHDGSNVMGWRAYCEDWGHVDHINAAVIAIKPSFLWYGK